MSHAALESGALVTATATGTNSATATITGVPGKKTYIAFVSASSDLAGGTVQIKDGSTVIWQDRVSNTCPGAYSFEGYLVASAGANVTVVVTGTSLSNANISAFQL